MRLKYLLISLRPKQWVKNLFVLAALVFAGRLLHLASLLRAGAAFFLFCGLAGSVYLINDWRDLESDREQESKKNRPLAAGKISAKTALFAAAFLLTASLVASFMINLHFGLVALCYMLLNLAYSFFLKKMPLLDIISVAVGFVLRAIAGAEAIVVQISPWLIVCTFFIALFLVIGKRRAEVINNQAFQLYTREFLDQLLTLTAGITILAYVLYTIDAQTVVKFETTALLYTTPFVVYGIFRYFYLVSQNKKGASPTETLLTDIPMLISVALWGLSVGIIIYL